MIIVMSISSKDRYISELVLAESVKKAILQSQIGAWEPKSRSLMADSRVEPQANDIPAVNSYVK